MYSSRSLQPCIALGIYPERQEPRLEWIDRIAASASGMVAAWVRPQPSRFKWIVDLVHAQAGELKGMSDDKILGMSRSLRQRLRSEGYREDLVAQAFALVREVAG